MRSQRPLSSVHGYFNPKTGFIDFLNALAKCLLISSVFVLKGADNEEMPSELFLEKVRKAPAKESWAIMSGEAIHRRAGKDTEKSPIRLAIRFTNDRTLAQIYINSKELYIIGQPYSSADKNTTIIPELKCAPQETVLANFGLKPEDLTLSFIYWNFVKELEKSTVKGRSCRVFILASPDGKENIRVSIEPEYFFPLKAEWIKNENSEISAPYRTIEVTSFKKESDFWFVDGFVIYGSGWKTKIDFSEVSAGFSSEGVPEKLFVITAENK